MKDIIFVKADSLAFSVYTLTRRFPSNEMFGITSQIRRAALSVPLNILEGYSRQSKKEYLHFLEIAYGSLKETKYLLYFSHKIDYVPDEQYKEVYAITEEIGKLLWSKIRTMKS